MADSTGSTVYTGPAVERSIYQEVVEALGYAPLDENDEWHDDFALNSQYHQDAMEALYKTTRPHEEASG